MRHTASPHPRARFPRHAPTKSTWETRLVIAILLDLRARHELDPRLRDPRARPTCPPKITATTIHVAPNQPPPYPVGIADAAEPSHVAPPRTSTLAGFPRLHPGLRGRCAPAGVGRLHGRPGRGPGGPVRREPRGRGQGPVAAQHLARPAYANKWASGGLCQCELAYTYGASSSAPGSRARARTRSSCVAVGQPVATRDRLQRDRQPGALDLVHRALRHAADRSVPELLKSVKIDGLAHLGRRLDAAQDHVHGGRQALGLLHNKAANPHIPMTLDLEQRPGCSRGPVCTTGGTEPLQVDWVAEYAPLPGSAAG